MNRVVEEVIPNYRYTDLSELNAVLGLYAVQASRGKQHSLTYQKKGLHYHPLSADGQPAREYLPARRFPSRPTLASLEQRFVENQGLRERHRDALTVAIDFTLAGKGISLNALSQELAKRGVSLVTDKGGGERIWFVDHSNKTVFEGAALGSDYSFAGVQRRVLSEQQYHQQQQLSEQQSQHHRLSL